MIRLATIGTGWIVEDFLKAAQLAGGYQWTGCYSRNAAHGEAFSRRCAWENPPRVFCSLEQLAADPDIDAVYIASPNLFHAPQSRLMLSHQKHVLCEKPLAVTPEQIAELQALARERGLIYLEAVPGLFSPRLRLLEQAAAQIGPLRLLRVDNSQYSSKYAAYLAGQTPNIFNPEMAAGCLMDIGIYCVYPVVKLLGMPRQVQASAQFLRTGADGSGAALLRYPGATAVLTYSKTAQAACGSELQGERGVLSFRQPSQIAFLERRFLDGQEPPLPLAGQAEPKAEQMSWEARAFRDLILGQPQGWEPLERYQELSMQVCQVLSQIRLSAGIHLRYEP